MDSLNLDEMKGVSEARHSSLYPRKCPFVRRSLERDVSCGLLKGHRMFSASPPQGCTCVAFTVKRFQAASSFEGPVSLLFSSPCPSEGKVLSLLDKNVAAALRRHPLPKVRSNELQLCATRVSCRSSKLEYGSRAAAAPYVVRADSQQSIMEPALC